MGSGQSSPASPAGSSGLSFTNRLSAMNPFASKPASGPTLGNAYNAQNNATKAANNAAKVAKNATNARAANNAAKAAANAPAPANAPVPAPAPAPAPANAAAGLNTNKAVQAVASSTVSPRIERVSSLMNGGKLRRNTRKKSRKNRKNCRR